jgi:hypothetical protein
MGLRFLANSCRPRCLLLQEGLFEARRWWLMPIILATQEAEIRRIEVRRKPRQTVHETLS